MEDVLLGQATHNQELHGPLSGQPFNGLLIDSDGCDYSGQNRPEYAIAYGIGGCMGALASHGRQ